MVELEALAAFDCLQWLRTGERAAQMLGCNQSTISRATRRCQQIFDIQLIKRAAEWQVQGDDTLLQAERKVHQLYRWTTDRPLRLDCQHWLRPSYAELDLQGWNKGNLNYMEYTRPLQLLRQGVIDAWLCSSPDHPQDTDLTCIPLCVMPAWLIARSTHPLLRQTRPPSLSSVSRYPVLPLPAGAFPVFQARLDALGFHSDFSQLSAIAEADGHDPQASEELALAIASPLTLSLYGDGWKILPVDLQQRVGDTLVLRRDLAGQPRAKALIESLAQHLRARAADQGEVEVLSAAPLE